MENSATDETLNLTDEEKAAAEKAAAEKAAAEKAAAEKDVEYIPNTAHNHNTGKYLKK